MRTVCMGEHGRNESIYHARPTAAILFTHREDTNKEWARDGHRIERDFYHLEYHIRSQELVKLEGARRT